MIRRSNRSSPSRPAASGLLFASTLGIVLLGSSCTDPQAPPPAELGDPTYRGIYDTQQGTLEFQLESPTGERSAVRMIGTDLVYDPSTQELRARVALRNAGNVPVSGAVDVQLGQFDPADVSPRNAAPMPCPLCPDCVCTFEWAYDYRGTCGEDDVLSAGETSTPVEWVLLVPAGESFSFRAQLVPLSRPNDAVIAGFVFTDANADGRRGPDEPGIPGAAVELVHGDASVRQETDASGRFAFEVSEPGLYEVVRSETSDCTPTTRLRLQVVIVRRADGTLSGFDRADFGCRGVSLGIPVTGVVFEDQDRDGQRDPGEPGIPGVSLFGSTPQCPTFAPIQARTDARGFYQMMLPSCEPPYVIHREPLAGYVDTTPNPVVFGRGAGEDSLPPPPTEPPQQRLVANFGVAPDGTNSELFIVGVVYNDLNRNGQREQGESGLPDVGVWASGLECLSPVAAYTRTNRAGEYRLAGRDVHCPLPWSVGSDVPPGFCPTTPTPVEIHGPPPPDGVFHVDFGLAACDSVPPPESFTITGFVFHDLDRDGSRDRGEPGIPAARLEMLTLCDAIFSTKTDAEGRYVFRGMCGAYGVSLVEPAFPQLTTPNPATFDPTTVQPGDTVILNFGVLLERPPG